MLIINDLHIGFNRVGGTTPTSREAMRTFLFDRFTALLEATPETHVLILGDLFDHFEIAGRDWVQTYLILQGWLLADSRRRLTLVAGNHDHSDKGHKVSSFQMLCTVLVESSVKVKVVAHNQFKEVEPGVFALAHCSNQDEFEHRLEQILEEPDLRTLLLHANYDNDFAVESDHSLNIDQEIGETFCSLGVNLVFAHEHQARTAYPAGQGHGKGAVHVLGNQWPTSVADCLGNAAKFAHVLRDSALTRIETWCASGAQGLLGVDWQRVMDALDHTGFVRVQGAASAAQAADVMHAVTQLRNKSAALVISNAVKVDGVAALEALPQSFEAAKRFDVLTYLQEHLDKPEFAAIQTLLERA